MKLYIAGGEGGGKREREKNVSYSLLGGERGELRRGWFLRFRVNYWALGCSQRGLHRRGFLLLAQLLRGFLRDRGNVLYRRQLVPILLSQMVLHHRVRVVPWTGHLLDVRVDALSVSIVVSLFSSLLLPLPLPSSSLDRDVTMKGSPFCAQRHSGESRAHKVSSPPFLDRPS